LYGPVNSWFILGSDLESWDDVFFLCVKLVFCCIMFAFSSSAVKELSYTSILYVSYNIKRDFFSLVPLYVLNFGRSLNFYKSFRISSLRIWLLFVYILCFYLIRSRIYLVTSCLTSLDVLHSYSYCFVQITSTIKLWSSGMMEAVLSMFLILL